MKKKSLPEPGTIIEVPPFVPPEMERQYEEANRNVMRLTAVEIAITTLAQALAESMPGVIDRAIGLVQELPIDGQKIDVSTIARVLRLFQTSSHQATGEQSRSR